MISDYLFNQLIEDAEEYAILTPDMKDAITLGGRLITKAVLKHMNPNKIAFTSGLDAIRGEEKGKLCIIGVGYTQKELAYFIDMGKEEIKGLVEIEMGEKN